MGILKLLDGDVAQQYKGARLEYRSRYTPIVRALRELDTGPRLFTLGQRRAAPSHCRCLLAAGLVLLRFSAIVVGRLC